MFRIPRNAGPGRGETSLHKPNSMDVLRGPPVRKGTKCVMGGCIGALAVPSYLIETDEAPCRTTKLQELSLFLEIFARSLVHALFFKT